MKSGSQWYILFERMNMLATRDVPKQTRFEIFKNLMLSFLPSDNGFATAKKFLQAVLNTSDLSIPTYKPLKAIMIGRRMPMVQKIIILGIRCFSKFASRGDMSFPVSAL